MRFAVLPMTGSGFLNLLQSIQSAMRPLNGCEIPGRAYDVSLSFDI